MAPSIAEPQARRSRVERVGRVAVLVALVAAATVLVGADVPAGFRTTVIDVPSKAAAPAGASFLLLCGGSQPSGIRLGDEVIGVRLRDDPRGTLSHIPGAEHHGTLEIEQRFSTAVRYTFVAEDGTRTELAEIPSFDTLAINCA